MSSTTALSPSPFPPPGFETSTMVVRHSYPSLRSPFLPLKQCSSTASFRLPRFAIGPSKRTGLFPFCRPETWDKHPTIRFFSRPCALDPPDAGVMPLFFTTFSTRERTLRLKLVASAGGSPPCCHGRSFSVSSAVFL